MVLFSKPFTTCLVGNDAESNGQEHGKSHGRPPADRQGVTGTGRVECAGME